MTDTTQQERESRAAFEAHHGGDLSRHPDGVYRIWGVECDWMLWQAARATPQGAEPVAEVYTMEALVPGGGVKYHARMLSACPPGTKLYTRPPEPKLSELRADAGLLGQARIALGLMLSYHGQGSADYADIAQVRAQEAYDAIDTELARQEGSAT